MAKWIVMLLMIGAAVFESLGDLSFRYSAILSRSSWLYVGIALYVIGTGIWAYTLRYEEVSTAIVVVNIINLILVIVVGVLLFHEHPSPLNIAGIILGVISIILMQL